MQAAPNRRCARQQAPPHRCKLCYRAPTHTAATPRTACYLRLAAPTSPSPGLSPPRSLDCAANRSRPAALLAAHQPAAGPHAAAAQPRRAQAGAGPAGSGAAGLSWPIGHNNHIGATLQAAAVLACAGSLERGWHTWPLAPYAGQRESEKQRRSSALPATAFEMLLLLLPTGPYMLPRGAHQLNCNCILLGIWALKFEAQVPGKLWFGVQGCCTELCNEYIAGRGSQATQNGRRKARQASRRAALRSGLTRAAP